MFKDLAILPTFIVGNKIWLYCGVDKNVEVTDVTISPCKNLFVYHYGINEWFYDEDIGVAVFRTKEELDEYLNQYFDL